MGREKQTISKEITYYQHVAAVTPAIRYDGPVPAYRRPITPIERPSNTYRLYGADFIGHPWRETRDYSRIRALGHAASIRWPGIAIEIVAESDSVGFMPIVKFRDGKELRWKGA